MNKMMKRLMAILLVCAMVLPQGIQVTAAEATPKQAEVKLYKGNLVTATGKHAVKKRAAAKEYDGSIVELYGILEERVKTAMLEGKEEVRIDDLLIRTDSGYGAEMIDSYSPYLTKTVEFQTSQTENYYYSYEFSNTMNRRETEEYFAFVDEEIEKIKDVVEEGKDAETKALILHDYIAKTYAYDEEFIYANANSRQSYSSGGLFINGIGVCQAYAYLYMYIMNMFEIPCMTVSSDEMVHMWNMIQLNGKYYHVDITWDDPTPDMLGYVSHEHFLLSDDEIQGMEKPHHGWDSDGIKCPSAYPAERTYWNGMTTPVLVEDGKRYVAKDMKLVEVDLKNGNERELYSFSGWKVWNRPGYYPMVFSGMELIDDCLYFNTDEGVYRIDLRQPKADATCVFERPDSVGAYIYGMQIKDGEIWYFVRTGLTMEDAPGRTASYDFGKPKKFERGSTGDVNEDEVTNLKDYMHMKKFEKKAISSKRMADDSDLTGDNKVNVDDLKVLSKMICEK